MKSTIMDFDLTIHDIFWRIEKLYKEKEIVSRLKDNEIVRYTYLDFSKRVRKLANFLKKYEIKNNVVGSIAWNTHRHLELYFAVPMLGGVLHTINVRFHPTEMEYVINFAKDKIVFYDEEIPKSLEENTNATFISMNTIDNIVKEETEIGEFEDVNEKDGAIMCFTSGTTGHPKGVIYSHRSVFIHSLTLLSLIKENDIVMPVVPMFHISAWDVPFATMMTGSKLVLPGIKPSSADLANLIEKERVTLTVGAPTVWISFLDYLRNNKYDISSLRYIITGGAEPPKGMVKEFLEKYGVSVIHAWGMTETEAITTINTSKNIEEISKQGISLPSIEYTLITPDGKEGQWDGKTIGELIIRGSWVINEYYNDEKRTNESFVEINGKKWLKTGDLVVISKDGNIKIVDRTKDIIKSGGEWISSIDLENAIMSYEPVLEAVVIGVKDEKWGERPIAMVVLKDEYKNKIRGDDILNYLQSLNKFPKWWLPDKILFVDSIPKTSTGKLDKKVLRNITSK
ncbi:long-chain-fatty-acid--CoA ligase [Acidianus manzaensis]|uniref:AMP-dependent synthetase n=1 Tax=Acidianus manzaensis TaxID=282676 RepID=A0A1W6JZ73_9CREN|nr:long-chain-fatty-acid--CoA ligase [Acidianus manzaensis]ARM75504.1 AMP-dependent synthetase [Acidianus manzaensis]